MYNILPPYRKTSKSTIYSNNFQLVNRNVNPIILKNGDGKNSLFIIQGTIKFPHSRLSSHSKKKFPHSRLRRSWGNFSLLFLLSLSWGNSIVPFMIHREFLFPLLAPSAPRRGNIPSPFFKMMGLGHFPSEKVYSTKPYFQFQNYCLLLIASYLAIPFYIIHTLHCLKHKLNWPCN